MCRISKLSEDWIVKGFHIHVYDIELVMRPDYQGGIVFKKLFRSVSDEMARPAIERARELLQDVHWRRLFHREAMRGREYVRRTSTRLEELATGRAAELTFILAALRKMGIT
jgi:hypothetical protein